MNGGFRTAETEAIVARRMRSVLDLTIGILIGIAAVMLTVGLGQGAQERVASAINALGSNLLIVTPGSTDSRPAFRGVRVRVDPHGRGRRGPGQPGRRPRRRGRRRHLDVQPGAGRRGPDLDVLRDRHHPVLAQVRAGTVTEGRFFTDADQDAGNTVAVLGSTRRAELFTGQPRRAVP